MDVTKTTRAGRPRSRVPTSKRSRDFLRWMDAAGETFLSLARKSKLARGTVVLAAYSDNPSRQSAASIAALVAAGVPESLLRAC